MFDERLKSRALSSLSIGAVLAVLIVAIGVGALVTLDRTPGGNALSALGSVTPASSSSSISSIILSETDNLPSTEWKTGLHLVMNSTEIQSGDSVNLSVYVRNALTTTNNVSAASKWALNTLGQGTGPCTSLNNDPFRIAAFDGYYTYGNISKAQALTIANPDATYMCTEIAQFRYLVFEPESDIVTVHSCQGATCQTRGPFPMQGSYFETYFQIGGYWANSTTSEGSQVTTSSAFHSLENGNYIIAVGDEWGDLALLHFSVSGENSNQDIVAWVQSSPQEQVFVTVVSDANRAPIQVANVSGFITVGMNGQNISYPLMRELTPSNGTVPLNIQSQYGWCTVGTYTAIILTGEGEYNVSISPPILHLGQLVSVTVGIPSGKIIDMHISNSAECVENHTTVTNGTGFFC